MRPAGEGVNDGSILVNYGENGCGLRGKIWALGVEWSSITYEYRVVCLLRVKQKPTWLWFE